MKKTWCIVPSVVSIVLLGLFLWTLRLYNQASSSQALWTKVIKCFDEGPSKVPPGKRCPTCPRNYIGFVSKNGQFGDSTIIDVNSARYKVRQTVSKDDSAGIVVFSVNIQKLK